jgi:peptidyl-prolyl cis-trans isomerase SurA
MKPRGADPLVRGRRPRRPPGIAPEFDWRGDCGSRGTRGDQGVRPTMLMPIHAGAPARDTRVETFRSASSANRRRQILCPALFLLILSTPAFSEIIDRIAVSVGTRVIAVSDLDREIRVTTFLNGVPADFSPAAKHATAERMTEQKLIQRELEINRYPVPDASEVAAVLAEFRAAHFKDDEEYRRALADRGITEQQVKDELLWQRTLLRFIEVRFRPGIQVSDQEIQDYFDKVVAPAARAAHPGAPVGLADYRSQIEETLAGKRVDDELDAWLKEARKRNEIVVHEDALR